MDIDKLFAAAKKKEAKNKAQQAQKKTAPNGPQQAPTSTEQPRKEEIKKRILKPKDRKKETKSSKQAKYTEDGFKIVREDELQVGGKGDTKDCPFNCQCCF